MRSPVTGTTLAVAAVVANGELTVIAIDHGIGVPWVVAEALIFCAALTLAVAGVRRRRAALVPTPRENRTP